MFRRFMFAALSLVTIGAMPVCAQIAIGQTADITGQVTGAFGARKTPLANGASVVQDEVVSTAAQSTARVAFHDLSSLAIAAQSSVKLDRFIYNPDVTASAASLVLARGAFRFVTGNSPSRNISVKTPTATIGLRGTVVDVLVGRGREIVVLKQGATIVCRARTCVNIDVPGTGVYVTSGGVSQPTVSAAAEFDFDAMTNSRFYLYRLQLGAPRGDNGAPAQSSSSGNSLH